MLLVLLLFLGVGRLVDFPHSTVVRKGAVEDDATTVASLHELQNPLLR